MKLLGISGSLREASYNTMLIREAARIFAPDSFALADLNLPLFNQDVEAGGQPESVAALLGQITEADAIVFSTTEYNGGPSGVLKNALDWISRPNLAVMADKPVAVLSATAGMAGGQRAKSSMYLYLGPFTVRLVRAPEVNVGAAHTKFDENGRLTDEIALGLLEKLMAGLKAAV